MQVLVPLQPVTTGAGDVVGARVAGVSVVAVFAGATVVVARDGRVVAGLGANVVAARRGTAVVAGNAAFFVRGAELSFEPPHAASSSIRLPSVPIAILRERMTSPR